MARSQRTNDPEGVRRRIVDTAFDAFVRHGYSATGLLEIRDKAKVSGGAMAHHFKAKRDLALAVIHDRIGPAVAQTWITPLGASADAPTAIDRVFAAIIAELTRNRAVSGCPLNNMAMEVAADHPDMRLALGAIFAAWQDALRAKFQADIDAGRARDLQPHRMAALVIAAYSGAMAMAKTRQDVRPLVDAQAELAALLAGKYRTAKPVD